jgi:hypothetical protein
LYAALLNLNMSRECNPFFGRFFAMKIKFLVPAIVVGVMSFGGFSAKPAQAEFGDDLRDIGRILEAIECAVEDYDCYDDYYRGGRHDRRGRDGRYEDKHERQRQREREQERAEWQAFEKAFNNYYNRYENAGRRQRSVASVVFTYRLKSDNPTAQGLDDVLQFSGWDQSDRELAQAEFKYLTGTYKVTPKRFREDLTRKIQSLYWYRSY